MATGLFSELELVSLDVEELEEDELDCDRDLEGDRLEVLPDGDLDLDFFFVLLWSDDRLSLVSEGVVDTYPVSF